MKSLSWCGPVAAALALLATPALSAQVVDLSLTDPDVDGFIYASGAFDWPPEGHSATATLTFSGLALIDAVFTGNVEERKTWWDEAIGGVWGNEYSLAYDCSLTGGCVVVTSPGTASGVLSTPLGFDRPCTPTTLGDCSSHFFPQFATFDGVFRVSPAARAPYSVSLTISDFTAVPEPAGWAMMIVGFGLVGSMLRRSRRGFAAV
ncbi:PEPxxWA-CTERM sorting domain-containing protein [Phenylobacterium sp.]|uniref:PEPxxWA-CTERM sorting domain-containing protein n=1 Tax=Phenylobacterium sp. TaxID=1871053 RepID=UPI0025D284A7|nr:PEPxxWA-CTERM sorting domain-containing protein [Phenylobacterium sp.]